MELDNTKYPNTRGSPQMRQSNAAVPLQGSRVSIYIYIYNKFDVFNYLIFF